MVSASRSTLLPAAAPGTGAGGVAVIVMAELAAGWFHVTKPTPIPLGSVPCGSCPSSKSSTRTDFPEPGGGVVPLPNATSSK